MINLTTLLDLSREATPGDLTPIKIAASLLPDTAEPSRDLCETLDNMAAIIFHVVFPIRDRTAEEWSLENWVPAGRKQVEDRKADRDLLASLGLLRPKEPIKRRL